jgi:hypothetical protein
MGFRSTLVSVEGGALATGGTGLVSVQVLWIVWGRCGNWRGGEGEEKKEKNYVR